MAVPFTPQLPNTDIQPSPQCASVLPQYPHLEQQEPKFDCPAQVWEPEHCPSLLGVRPEVVPEVPVEMGAEIVVVGSEVPAA